MDRPRGAMADLLAQIYPWTKTLHILSFTAWMAGLFYLPRLFVYHAEAVTIGTDRDTLFQTMERRLLKQIMTPAMISTWVFGLLLVATPGIVSWAAPWPYLKAVGVIGLTGFHHWCGVQRRTIAGGHIPHTGRHYRMMNEAPTLLLILIVVAVVVRPF